MPNYRSNESWDYHERYLYTKEEVKAVRKCIQDGLWIGKRRGDIAFCLDLLKELSNKLCELRHIPNVTGIIMDEYDYYDWSVKLISLRHISIVSFLHEWRHHYQCESGTNVHNEGDCRAYSLGLFKTAFPIAFDNAWRNGQLMWMPPYPISERRCKSKWGCVRDNKCFDDILGKCYYNGTKKCD